MRMIHTITVFQKIDPQPINETLTLPQLGDRRCVGWFESFNEADYAVKINYKNMHDGMYKYAIIEEMGDGIFVPENKRFLYEWNEKDQCYQLINEPKLLSKLSNFGIG